MAGGPTTTALALAVAGAGGFPFLVGGYKTPEVLAAEITALQASGHPFGVNLFVPIAPIIDEDAFRTYVRLLQPDADRYGLTLDPLPAQDNDSWEQKLALLIQNPVPVISLTFALPEPAAIASLQRAGSRVLASVTTVAEAHQAEAAGVDGLIVQGPSAGGHSATFDPERRIDPVTTEELVRTIRAESSLPIIAAGGIDGPETVRRLLDAGAEAAAVGTLLLLADEAGTSPTHRAALADTAFTETVLTRAFTGRPARALHNGFIDRHGQQAPNAYPAVHHLTRALRQAAGRAGNSDSLHLWAGTGWRSAPGGPAAGIIGWLAGEQPRPPAMGLL